MLVCDNIFRLPNKIDNIYDKSEDRIIDATETKIDRPKKNQKEWYSGKKKQYTIKIQVEIGVDTLLIYSTFFAKGSVHDFQLFKNTKIDYEKDTTIFLDKGYVGIEKYHNKSIIPLKESKNHKLSKEKNGITMRYQK